MKNFAAVLWLLLMIAVGLVQLRLGYLGIEHHLGTLTAVVLSIAAFLGILLPVTIGSYFGAVDVMGWPTWVGLLVSVPGLLFATPMIMLNIIQSAVPIGAKRSSKSSELSASQIPSNEYPTMIEQTYRVQIPEQGEDTRYLSEEDVNEEFDRLAAYSSRLAEIDDNFSGIPGQYRAEFRQRVLMTSTPLVHADAIAREVIARYNADLNPLATDESNFYYQRCLELLGDTAAEKFLRIMKRLGDTADPSEVYAVIEQEVQDERRADAAYLEKKERRRIQLQKRQKFFERIVVVFFWV
jgi:hypothetical protein